MKCRGRADRQPTSRDWPQRRNDHLLPTMHEGHTYGSLSVTEITIRKNTDIARCAKCFAADYSGRAERERRRSPTRTARVAAATDPTSVVWKPPDPTALILLFSMAGQSTRKGVSRAEILPLPPPFGSSQGYGATSSAANPGTSSTSTFVSLFTSPLSIEQPANCVA